MLSSHVVLMVSLVGLPAPAAQEPAAREPVARNMTENALLVRRLGPDRPWLLTAPRTTLCRGDLVLGGGGQVIDSLNGAIRLSLRGDWNGLSPYPIIETAVSLHASKEADFELTLERGRIDLTNTKPAGAARVRVHVGKAAGDVVLRTPGSAVSLEIYGRWPEGTRFHRDGGAEQSPAYAFVVVALSGSVDLVAGQKHVSLQAPPGPALLLGDGIGETDPSPQHLDQLPDWATDKVITEQGKAVQASLGKLRRLASERGITAALEELLKSDDPGDRRLAVHALGALDDLPRLGQALRTAQHPDVWENGILTLRHWIGRGPGQDRKLYQALTKVGFPEAEAEIVLNLLHTFSEGDRKQPETYEALLDYLESDRLAIRSLAHWHLVRLVPAGKAIGYNPVAPGPERTQAVQAWRKLIPRGGVPSRSQAPGK
jgi:hypothetical protein